MYVCLSFGKPSVGMMMSASVVNGSRKLSRQRTKLLLPSTTLTLLCVVVAVFFAGGVSGLEMEKMQDGCLQVTLKVHPLLVT